MLLVSLFEIKRIKTVRFLTTCNLPIEKSNGFYYCHCPSLSSGYLRWNAAATINTMVAFWLIVDCAIIVVVFVGYVLWAAAKNCFGTFTRWDRVV